MGNTETLVALEHELSRWSQETFGTDSERGPYGALKHLMCEVAETLIAPDDLEEYADCLLLIIDASRRAGFSLGALIEAASKKLEVNKARTWPSPTSQEPVFHIK